jgi:hypothetical protein
LKPLWKLPLALVSSKLSRNCTSALRTKTKVTAKWSCKASQKSLKLSTVQKSVTRSKISETNSLTVFLQHSTNKQQMTQQF